MIPGEIIISDKELEINLDSEAILLKEMFSLKDS